MVIDVNASFGGRESSQQFTLQSLERELGRTPVTRAFIGANEGSFDQRSANDHLLQICSEHDGWMPAPTIQPRDTFVWEEEIDRMAASGARVFRLDPERSAWPVGSVFLSMIFEKLAETGSVVIVPATQPGLPTAVAEQSTAHGVPVIFTEARYFPLTEILPLMRRHERLFVETSRLTSPGGIELVVDRVGSGRVVYGSGACRYPAWIAWRMLEEARISDADREAIAFGNASRLLRIDAATPSTGAPSTLSLTSSTVESSEEEARFPPAVDVHLHDRFPGGPFPPFDAASYGQALAESGIVAGVSSSATAIFHDLTRGNDQQQMLLDALPTLRGYVVVDPRYPDQSATELQRLEWDHRWIGVKVHCAHASTPTADASFTHLVDMAAAYGKPMLIHPLGSDWPEAMSRLARRHPAMIFVAAHGGYGDAPHPTHDAVLRIADEPNIVTEFCSTYLAVGAIRRGIETLGAERVLFGSDFPLISLPYMRTAFREAELTSAEADRIYVQNALRVFPSLFEILEGRLPATS